ncbi:hypothetical protein [Sharpea azabuensis]|uniref:hypothetical protein n=1 Tax=Sharpea azabuensis TaxID=322505 RepID=UPI00051C26C5|nr:hypothetical protein [Sharpea azabuensis]
MGTNSIKANLTKDSIISDIKLLLGADVNKKNVFIVVEGDDDIKFLKGFMNNNVTIYESFSGKNGIEEIIDSNVICDSRVIGIRDKDYCKCTKNHRIFFYDRCCLEMMIIGFDESFDRIYNEYYQGELDAKELKKHILNELYKLSKIRKHNEECNIGINFKGLSFISLIDNDGKLDEEKLIYGIEKINSGKQYNFRDIILNSEDVPINDLLDITNGHDFIAFFKVLCDKNCNQSVNDKGISSALRVSFNNELLQKTALYKTINDYFDNEISVWCC